MRLPRRHSRTRKRGIIEEAARISAAPAQTGRLETQPPASAAPEDLAPEDYAQSTGYTYKSRQPKDRGYSSSRKEGRKLKENLRYGQYLEVPKGDQAIFSPQRSRLRTALIVIGILIAIAIIVYFLWELLL